MLAIRSEAFGKQPGNKRIRADEGRGWSWGEDRLQLLLVTGGRAMEKPDNFATCLWGLCACARAWCACFDGLSPPLFLRLTTLYSMNLEPGCLGPNLCFAACELVFNLSVTQFP